MVKSYFKDPAAIKKQDPKDQPIDGKKSPWDFTCPQYDERSSCYVNTGTHYGVGHAQPVGHEGDPKMMAGTLPEHRAKTMKIDEVG